MGRQLYALMEEVLREQGVVRAISLIVKPEDEYSDYNSIQFHEKMGYRYAGELKDCGYKFHDGIPLFIWISRLVLHRKICCLSVILLLSGRNSDYSFQTFPVPPESVLLRTKGISIQEVYKRVLI